MATTEKIPAGRFEEGAMARMCTETYNAAPRGCEVAKLALCGEDVKTAAVPPCEVPLSGCGCVK